jgi:CRP/FNR family transcriptional regulator, cyclic AMP receptor protein
MSDHPDDPGRETLRATGRSTPFQRGERLIAAGAVSDEVLLVETGLVKVVLADADGVETVANVFGPGVLLGETGVLDEAPRSAHVLALLDGRAVHVAARPFVRLYQEDAAVARLVRRTWGNQRRDADHRQLCQAYDVATRVRLTLLRWARSAGVPTASGLLLRGPSQRDLAQAVGASEKSVEAALAPLRAAGLLFTDRLAFRIPSPDLLERQPAEPRRKPRQR